jgi:hypothetical protein
MLPDPDACAIEGVGCAIEKTTSKAAARVLLTFNPIRFMFSSLLAHRRGHNSLLQNS